MPPKKRVIFVDDQPELLQGLRRRLAALRSEWEMVFCTSGAEALEVLAKAPFDVIVSDMRMPQMDGAELLERVRNLYPHTARIALSGQSDQEMTMHAVGPSHQYLSKPCDIELLKNTITRACTLRELLQAPELERAVGGLASLPVLPSVYQELSAELSSPLPSLEKVAAIISKDISLTAKLLQLANSEFFGVAQHLTNAREAVNYLGLEVVRSLLLTFNLLAELSPKTGLERELTALWNHSLTVAVCARQIANLERLRSEEADVSFTAGLLHDIGKIVLGLGCKERPENLDLLAAAEDTANISAERAVLGTSHQEIGAYLLALWGLPDPIVEAAAFHHEPDKCSGKTFLPLTAVHAADAIFWAMQAGQAGDPAACQVSLPYLNMLGIADHLKDWQLLCEVTVESRLSDDLRRLI